jgi:hypothetical protein
MRRRAELGLCGHRDAVNRSEAHPCAEARRPFSRVVSTQISQWLKQVAQIVQKMNSTDIQR